MHLRGGDAATSIVRGHACSKCGHVPCSPLATHAVAAIAEQVPFPASCINGSTSCVADLRLTLSSGGGEIYVYVPGHNHNYTAEERILLRNVSTTAEREDLATRCSCPRYAADTEVSKIVCTVCREGQAGERGKPATVSPLCGTHTRTHGQQLGGNLTAVCCTQDQQRWAKLEAESNHRRMIKHADLTTAELLQLRATKEKSRRPDVVAAVGPFIANSSRSVLAKRSTVRAPPLRLKQPLPNVPAQHRPWEADCKTWAIRDKLRGTVVVYKHDDGLVCPVPGKCMHQLGASTYHG